MDPGQTMDCPAQTLHPRFAQGNPRIVRILGLRITYILVHYKAGGTSAAGTAMAVSLFSDRVICPRPGPYQFFSIRVIRPKPV